MNASFLADISQHECANDIAFDSGFTVVLTPVDIRTTRLSSAIDDSCGFVLVDCLIHLMHVLHACRCSGDILALTSQ